MGRVLQSFKDKELGVHSILMRFAEAAVAHSAAVFPARQSDLHSAFARIMYAGDNFPLDCIDDSTLACASSADGEFADFGPEGATFLASQVAIGGYIFRLRDDEVASLAEDVILYSAEFGLLEMRADALLLEAGVPVDLLVKKALWTSGMSGDMEACWLELKSLLLVRNSEQWDVWTDWYEARLGGEPVNEDEEIARVAEVSVDEWAAGPAVANERIKEICARFRSDPG